MRLDDVLSDEMLRLGPKLPKEFLASLLWRAGIVNQCIEPHVGDIAIVEGDLYAPSKPTFGPRDAEIADRFTQHPEHFVSIALRSNEICMSFDMFSEAILILAHPKKIVFFLDQRRFH